MPKENNKMQVDIDTLKKQNVNDLLSIKEIYSKLEELGEKITQFKYIDNTLVKKLKKEYENLKKIILDENIQIELFLIFIILFTLVSICELIVSISLVNFAGIFSSKIILFNFSYSFFNLLVKLLSIYLIFEIFPCSSSNLL